MIDMESIVYTKLKYLITQYLIAQKYTKYNFSTATPTIAPTEFPTIVIEQIDNSINSTNLENDELSVGSAIKIEIYTNTDSALAISRGIENVADDAMKSMYYKRIFGFAKIDNLTDATILKRVGRYSRTISDGDTV